MVIFLILLILIVITYNFNTNEHFINEINILSELNESESEDLHNSLEHVHLKSNNSIAQEISHGESIYNNSNNTINLEENDITREPIKDVNKNNKNNKNNKRSFYNILGSIFNFNISEEIESETRNDINLDSEINDETTRQQINTTSEVHNEEEIDNGHKFKKNIKIHKKIFPKKNEIQGKDVNFNKIKNIEIDFSLEDISKNYKNVVNNFDKEKNIYNCNQLEYNYGDKEHNIFDNTDLSVNEVQPSNYVNFRKKFNEANTHFKKKNTKDNLEYWTKRSDIARPWFKPKD